MTVLPPSRTSANGWLKVFGSPSEPPGELPIGKEIARQLKSVAQAVPARPPQGTTVGHIGTDEGRRSREAQISHAIDSVPIDMAPGLKPLFSAFRIIGVGHDDALQHSLDAIDRAAVQMKGGYIDAARIILKDALCQLAPVNSAGGRAPPASPLAAAGRPMRPPGA